MLMTILIGTSGWSYDHWQGVLYPPGLPARDRLACYVQQFPTVEVNSTFYRWPADHVFEGWRQRLPDGFQLAVKAPRGLTHGARLYAPETWLARIERGLACLGDRRGALLVQTPPDLELDLPRLEYLLARMPAGVPAAFEFRHPSWHCDAVFGLLERYAAAYCVMSGAGLPCILRATAPLVYVRMHGPSQQHLYAGAYPEDDLRWWADRIREWQAQNHDVLVYFNNDGYGHAVRNALALRQLLG